MLRIVLSTLVSLTLAAAAHAAPQDDASKQAAVAEAPPAGPVDEAFVRDAALDGLAQMDLNYDALNLSHRADVRAFALDTVNYHAPALKELEQLAALHAVDFPKALDEYPAYIPDRPWENGDAASFDAVFMREQVRRVEQEVDLFMREAYDGQDPDLRAYAWANIMQLRHRLLVTRRLLERLAPGEAP